MPRKSSNKKDDEAHAEPKNVKKKGKAMVAGRTQPSSDSGNPDIDIERAMHMKAQPLRFDKSAPSSKHPVVIHKPQSRKTHHALTAAVAAAAASAEDTTGSQRQEPAKPPKKKPRKKAPSSAPSAASPPSPSPAPIDPPPSDSDETRSWLMKMLLAGKRRPPSPRC